MITYTHSSVGLAYVSQAGVKNAWHVDLQQLTHMAECEDNSATFLTMVS